MNTGHEAKKSQPLDSMAISKDGYAFNTLDAYWKLSKDVTVSLGYAESLRSAAQTGFRLALQRYAEEMSAHYTEC